ncbi:MAG: PulJ/GspJ family protein [Acidimicrobiales bacterium]
MLRLPRRHPGRSRRREAGFTVVELMVTSAIMLVALGVFGGLLVSLTGATNRGDALVTNEQDVSTVLTQLNRDLRSSNPLLPLALTSNYPDEVEMALVDPTTGGTTDVTWKFDPTTQTLTRQLGSGTADVVLTGVKNSTATPAVPFFSYFDDQGDNLVTGGAPPGTVATCTTNVQVQVVGAAEPGPQPFREQSDVQLRNQLADLAAQGGNPC